MVGGSLWVNGTHSDPPLMTENSESAWVNYDSS